MGMSLTARLCGVASMASLAFALTSGAPPRAQVGTGVQLDGSTFAAAVDGDDYAVVSRHDCDAGRGSSVRATWLSGGTLAVEDAVGVLPCRVGTVSADVVHGRVAVATTDDGVVTVAVADRGGWTGEPVVVPTHFDRPRTAVVGTPDGFAVLVSDELVGLGSAPRGYRAMLLEMDRDGRLLAEQTLPMQWPVIGRDGGQLVIAGRVPPQVEVQVIPAAPTVDTTGGPVVVLRHRIGAALAAGSWHVADGPACPPPSCANSLAVASDDDGEGVLLTFRSSVPLAGHVGRMLVDSDGPVVDSPVIPIDGFGVTALGDGHAYVRRTAGTTSQETVVLDAAGQEVERTRAPFLGGLVGRRDGQLALVGSDRILIIR